MSRRTVFAASVCTVALAPAGLRAEAVRFAAAPSATAAEGKMVIRFAVSAPTDVEVAVLDAAGRAVRHLAAGVLGGPAAPPAPLQGGLSQRLTWDLRDDFGKPAVGGPFRVRVRAGMGMKLGRFIGGDPYVFGAVVSLAADEKGNLYVLGYDGGINQRHMTLRLFDPEGRYVREIMPFPADLAPEAMRDVARWDAAGRTFRPRNLKSLNPDFYGTGRREPLLLASASTTGGVVLTDATRIYTLAATGAVRGEAFATKVMWPKKLTPWGAIPNSGGGPRHLAISPDGRTAYLSGIFTCKTRYGHKPNPALPPGRVYRMRLDGTDEMREFVTIDVDHVDGAGGAWTKGMGYGFSPRGPVHGVAVDAKGRLYLCDRQRGRIAVFDESAREVGHVPVPYADQVAVHPRTGSIYVMQKDRVSYSHFHAKLLKYDHLGADARPAAEHLFDRGTRQPQMALSVTPDRTVVWVAGTRSGIVALVDKGTTFEPMETRFPASPRGQLDWNRMAVDFARDEVYVSDGGVHVWRYDGRTGQGRLLTKDGRPFLVNDLAVGYDGLLYVRVSGEWDGSSARYSGPFLRLDRDLSPVPYAETGTHVLSKYIYSRYGVGYAERGIGVGPDGKAYLSFMYRWVAYMVGGFDAHGRPLKGRHLKGKVQADNFKKGQNKALDSAVIGPVPAANGGIRVDLAGNLYVGMRVWPKGRAFPKAFEKDKGYQHSTGCVVKFGPQGGRVANLRGNADSVPTGKEGLEMIRGEILEGALAVYPGLGPFSHAGFGGNTCCVCRVPRFDLDRYGRLAVPNAVANCVQLLDNAGNVILEFGKYGNFDSQYVNPFSQAGRKGHATVSVPPIPLAWPTCAGFSAAHLYVTDTYNRRVVRVDPTYRAEATAAFPRKERSP